MKGAGIVISSIYIKETSLEMLSDVNEVPCLTVSRVLPLASLFTVCRPKACVSPTVTVLPAPGICLTLTVVAEAFYGALFLSALSLQNPTKRVLFSDFFIFTSKETKAQKSYMTCPS